MKAKDKVLDRVRAAAREHAFSRRSEVYRWLRDRYAEIEEMMTAHDPSWHVIAAEIAREGISGGRGRPPTGRAVRRIWQRVRRDVAKELGFTVWKAEHKDNPPPRAPSPA